MNWQPGASAETLRARAALLSEIRAFFNHRDILEVETPLLCRSGVTDPAIEPLSVTDGASVNEPRFLQTSPEYAMKRMLAVGSGPIYQISRSFRDGELGSRHNPEFSILEWYRPDFDCLQLMSEVADLVCQCLGDKPIKHFTYRELFRHFLDIDAFTATLQDLQALARDNIEVNFDSADRDLWLDLLMSHLIEPRLVDQGLCFVYDYPVSQAALSRIVRVDGAEVGQRFELYVNGVELANGYCELTDPVEQRARFEADNRRRRENHQPVRPIDELLLAAMEHGLPACSGVALGVDRLLMLVTGLSDIREVLAFDWGRC